MTANLLTLNSS